MKKILILSFLGMVLLCSAQQRSVRVDTPEGIVQIYGVRESVYVETIIENIHRRIAELRSLYDTIPECYELISPAVAQIEMLILLLPRCIMVTPIEVEQINPMSAEAFANFLLLLENEPFADDRLLLLKQVLAKNYLTTYQLASIIDKFAFSDDKLKAVKIALPRLVDPENAFILRDKFEFDQDKQKFMQMISE
ncbi:DUF4476 domain-containing protein [bacterium]|nr:DUF4476 domain-containing protein [bacterium]